MGASPDRRARHQRRQDLHEAMLILPLRGNLRLPSRGQPIVVATSIDPAFSIRTLVDSLEGPPEKDDPRGNPGKIARPRSGFDLGR